MAKFFVPLARDAAQAEEVWNSIVAFANKTTKWKPGLRRIQRLLFTHNGKTYQASVGELFSYGDGPGEVVIAILECPDARSEDFRYLICTKTRGVGEGMPYLVGAREVQEVVPFDRES